MRQISSRFVVLAAVLAAINIAGWLWIRQELLDLPAASPDGTVKVALATQNVDEAERLSFEFDKPVTGAKSPEELVTHAPLRIEPLPLGYWEWRTPMRLDYVLAAPLPPGRKFHVVPVANFAQDGSQVVQADGDVEIRTKRLAVTACQFQSADREHVNLMLTFNQPVDPGDLLRQMKIVELPNTPRGQRNASGAANAATDIDKLPGLVTSTPVTKPAESILVRCQRPTGSLLQVHLTTDLKGHGGELALAEKFARILEVPRRFALLRSEAQTNWGSELVEVQLHFSASLDREQKLPTINVIPTVEGLEVQFGHEHHSGSELRLIGNFREDSYRIEVPGTLLSSDGTTLGDQQSTTVEVPERYPSVRFTTNDGGFLSPHGNLLLDIKTINISGLKFEAAQVHRNNLIAHLDHSPTTRTARPLSSTEAAVQRERNTVVTSALELRKLIGDRRGIFNIRAAATDHSWTSDESVVTVTDIAVTAKRERDGLVIWATSLKTAQPLAGVQVTALTYSNQTLGSGVTQADGTLRLPIDPKHPDGKPWVILAEQGEDAAFLQLDRTQWVLDDVDQGGKPTPQNYDVLLYAERGVYRPGETLHVSGILRDVRGQTPGAFPLRVTVTRPDRRVAATVDVTPEANQHGTFSFDVPTRDSFQTGPYRLTVTLPGSDEVLGSLTTLVEAFEPVRIEVQAQAEKPLVTAGEVGIVVANGKYLFGQPAADLPVRLSGEFRRGEFTSTESRGFTFGERSAFNTRELPPQEATLDAAGLKKFEVTPPEGLPRGWWQGRFVVTVTETGGRSTSQQVGFTLDNAGRHIGLRSKAEGIAPIGEPIGVDWVVRTSQDQLAEPAPIELELSRVEYDWVFRSRSQGTTWESIERLVPVSKQTVGADAASGTATVKCLDWGRYRLTAIDSKSGNRSRLEWYASSPEYADRSLSVNRPERVELILDKPNYAPGATAKVLIRSPFAGTAWLTLEAENLKHQEVVTLTGQSTTVDLHVPADLRGGAFVSASVVRAINPQEKTWLPHRAAGLARLVVDHATNRLPVAIDAPSQAQPASAVKVNLQVESQNRPARVHLWAVDEGILLTTAFRTPNPHQHFLAAKRSEVTTSDIFNDLLPDNVRAASVARIGGDDEGDEDLRGGPQPSRKRESVVVWRNWATTDDAGRLSLDVLLPEHTGRLRWMAVAVQDDRYGHSEFNTTVTSPLLVETSWPRFAAPGDQLRVPVKLFNSTMEDLTAKLDVQPVGPLTLQPLGERANVVVRPGHPEVVWLDVVADGIGEASVSVSATSQSKEHGALASRQLITLPVRAPALRGSESQTLVMRAGQPLTLPVPGGFVPERSKQTLVIGAQPKLQLLPAIDALIDYPYGCVEQTSSRIAALLAASDVIHQATPEAGRKFVVDDLINSGIVRLWSMQTTSGALSYWPGLKPDVWCTAYAGGILAECQQRGYAIDVRFRDELTKFLEAALNGRTQMEDGLSADLRAQICRTLAAFGKPPIGWMSKLSEDVPALDTLGRSELARAWFMAGRRDRALAVLTKDTREAIGPHSYNGRITSPLTQQANLLRALVEISPEHEWVPVLTVGVEAARKNGTWHSTLENAAAISALAQASALTKQEPIQFKGSLRTGLREPISFDHSALKTLTFDGRIEPLQIQTEGTGTYFVTLTTTGLKTADSIVAADKGLEVRRKWSKLEGFKVGDLVEVEVTLRSRGNETFIPNVVVVDALPAGFEVENPRLATSANNGDETQTVDRTEFLDDRVLLFGTAYSGQQTFRYSIRATTVGTFDLPPIQATSMYSPEIVSIFGAGRVSVAP